MPEAGRDLSFNLRSRGKHLRSGTRGRNRGPVSKRVLGLALIAALGTQAAWAEPITQRVRQARSQRATAMVTLHELEGQVSQVQGQLTIAEHLVDAATVRLGDARSEERNAPIHMARAQ